MDAEEHVERVPALNAQQQHSLRNHVLEIKLETFVMRFVKEFEAKLRVYSLISDGAIPKSGRYATTFAEIAGQGLGTILGGVAGLAVGLPGPVATAGRTAVGAIAKGIGDKVGRSHHQLKVTKLAEFIYYFEHNRTEFRKMLVKVGLDIFQSFEMQFGRVSSELSERAALNRLAVDAMDRAIDYISRTLAETDLDYYTLILEGVKLGQSKGELVLNMPTPGRRKGFGITYKHEAKEMKWKTASLYSKVGIVVIINKHERSYYKSKCDENKTYVKYGFRRCFSYEKMDQLESFYTQIHLSESDIQLLEYGYYYNSDDVLNEKISDIFKKLESDPDQTLGFDRIQSLLKESKNEILEKLHLLKPMYNESGIKSFILSSMETCLKKLKFEEYLAKFELKIGEQFESKTKAFWIQLEELKNKFEVIALTNAAFQDSIWFDVRQELINFTGRKDILQRIERELILIFFLIFVYFHQCKTLDRIKYVTIAPALMSAATSHK